MVAYLRRYRNHGYPGANTTLNFVALCADNRVQHTERRHGSSRPAPDGNLSSTTIQGDRPVAAQNSARIAHNQTNPLQQMTAARDYTRRFRNLLTELRLQPGIHQRIESALTEFSDAHPNVRASYISRSVDETYFQDGACGWEAQARPKLQGIALEGENMFEFLAFSHGLRMHTTPIATIMNVEELWLEAAPAQPFVLRVCFYHSFPATTILYAPDAESQEEVISFVKRLKFLRGF